MTIHRDPSIQRFTIGNDNVEHFVYDRDRAERAAGPYATEVQAAYVAFWLNHDPTHTPFAPNPSEVVLAELRTWRP